MVAFDIAKRHLLRRRKNLAVAQRQLLRGIVEEPVAAGLCLKAHREGGITRDVDARHMVHLDPDIDDFRHLPVPAGSR
ncbi:hypothetical protein D9M72_532110 [compost metagenome]